MKEEKSLDRDRRKMGRLAWVDGKMGDDALRQGPVQCARAVQ